jgi:hypothetical protein
MNRCTDGSTARKFKRCFYWTRQKGQFPRSRPDGHRESAGVCRMARTHGLCESSRKSFFYGQVALARLIIALTDSTEIRIIASKSSKLIIGRSFRYPRSDFRAAKRWLVQIISEDEITLFIQPDFHCALVITGTAEFDDASVQLRYVSQLPASSL